MIEVSFEAPAEPLAIVATTRLPHPVARVWQAYTEPLFLQRWWAPHGYTNRAAEIDATPGGAWQLVQTDSAGNSFSFYGRVESLERQSLLTRTLVSELFPDVTVRVRVEMAGTAHGTLVATSYVFPDERARAGFLGLGGVERLREELERLDALLLEMR
ncbi:SRPBCC family protein [Demequina pelophila]|uniref:SRPBCC family protein n=1 Tax=Demequina pelophila TaxID=1638984 RepID=UPI000785DC4A|nr:SRPBCC domain-containing protein [Demequina pelophila]